MKKLLFCFMFILSAAVVFAVDEYTLSGILINTDTSVGNAATANSFATLSAYRLGIAGQIGYQNLGETTVYPKKIYSANGTLPALYLTDVGGDWAGTPAAALQEIVAVLEVYEGNNGWAGGSFVSCVMKTITIDDLGNGESAMPTAILKNIPAPALKQAGADFLTISFTGIDLDNISGYTLYRTDEAGKTIPASYTAVTTAAQQRSAEVEITDNWAGLAPGENYYYCVSVNFTWGGGGGAAEFFETGARSVLSTSMNITAATYTPTQTHTFTPTMTYSDTYTATATMTPTFTLTHTQTATNTVTATETRTSTITATFTPTATATPTRIPLEDTIAESVRLFKVIVFPNPVKGKDFNIAFMADGAADTAIYVYNLKGEQVSNVKCAVKSGVNIVRYERGALAPGIYAVKIALDYDKTKLPTRKFAVIR